MITKLERLLVRSILENASKYEWSLQGFGMLRLYLPNDARLNIWDSRYRIPNVSMIHNHPWDFESTVVSGSLLNERYQLCEDTSTNYGGGLYHSAMIKPGPGGGVMQGLPTVRLIPLPLEAYRAGDQYEQRAHEVHMSLPSDGTITVNYRTRRDLKDEAMVFWPVGTDWVSAEPRQAMYHEIERIVNGALIGLADA